MQSSFQGEAAAGFLSFAAGHEALVAVLSAAAPDLLMATRLGAGNPAHPAKARRGFRLGRSLHAIPMAIEAFAKRAGYALVDEFYDAAVWPCVRNGHATNGC